MQQRSWQDAAVDIMALLVLGVIGAIALFRGDTLVAVAIVGPAVAGVLGARAGHTMAQQQQKSGDGKGGPLPPASGVMLLALYAGSFLGGGGRAAAKVAMGALLVALAVGVSGCAFLRAAAPIAADLISMIAREKCGPLDTADSCHQKCGAEIARRKAAGELEPAGGAP